MASPAEREIHHTFCRICEALCGLEVTLERGRVSGIRPDTEHVTTRGFACVKGLKQHKLLEAIEAVCDLFKGQPIASSVSPVWLRAIPRFRCASALLPFSVIASRKAAIASSSLPWR